jgi:hypothetical protein
MRRREEAKEKALQ